MATIIKQYISFILNKENQIQTKHFYCNDLYRQWKALINKSQSSVKIFTPYLDSTINKLLEKVSSHIEITIITSLESDNLFERGYQLMALKDAINNKCRVLNLEGLHAKILLVDNEYISLGSQNFTKRGRKNREAGFISEATFKESQFLESLQDWENQSTSIDLDLINSLLDYLEENYEDIKNLKRKFDRDINQIFEDFQNKNEFNQVELLENYNSTTRFAQGEVILSKTVPPPNYDYYSFFAGEKNNLCKWIKTTSKGEKEIELNDYDYYPALNVDTQRMSFVRIHTSRITFRQTSFRTVEIIDKYEFDIVFSFLKSKRKGGNIKIELSNPDIGETWLYLQFNGKELKIKNSKFHNNSAKIFFEKNLKNKDEELNNLLLRQLEPYGFTTRKTAPKDIEKFINKDHYNLGILDFKGYPILIFRGI